jgi:serine/threonine protein kinase/putative intracellular protease/amidase
MAVQTSPHPKPETLAAFNNGTLAEADRIQVERHVTSCDSCCSALAGLSDDRLIGIVRQAAADPAATAAMVDVPDLPPELVNHPKYRIIGELGAGGMGVVYRAEHLVMGREVALKVVARRYTSNPDAVERFRREVRAAAKLNHPNIVTAHDAEEANGLHFLVMEYVDGISLDRLVQRKGPLKISTACQCIRQAAQGLQHAHERGMVHRDIKPHNLMVTRKGQVKVLDFGLARIAVQADLPATNPNVDRTVTSPSLAIGTPDYLAPEQARNAHNVDIRADIYALGCVLYFLLTGRPPFPHLGSAIEKMLAQVQDEPEPVRHLRPEVPEELAQVVAKMMAKDPASRFDTPAEVAAAVRPFTRADAIIDDAPDIVDTPTVPVVDGPTPPVAELETEAIVRPNIKRRKTRKRPKRRQLLPFVAIGALAILIIGTGGLIAAFWPWGNTSGGQPNGTGGDTAAGKRVLFVVPSQGLWYPDYGPVVAKLSAADVDVVTAATRDGECLVIGQPPGGARVTPNRLLREVKASDYAAILFCGQNVTEFCWPQQPGYADTARLILEAGQGNKLLAAICVGQTVLLRHGVLHDKQIAASKHMESKYAEFGELKLDWNRRVVLDGRTLTAASPDDASAFADAIVAALAK